MSDAAKKCFVISPIGDDSTPERAKQKKHANTVLKTFIRPALKGFIDEVVRADEIAEPGDINRQVLERLVTADLVIADLSFHNPNVFYELAVRHMLGKPYVQLINKGENIPFDIGSKRTIRFDTGDLDGLEETRAQIRQQAEACFVPGFKVDTPLGYAIDVQTLREGDATQRTLSTVLERIDLVLEEVAPWRLEKSPVDEATAFAEQVIKEMWVLQFPDLSLSRAQISAVKTDALIKWSTEGRQPGFPSIPLSVKAGLARLAQEQGIEPVLTGKDGAARR